MNPSVGYHYFLPGQRLPSQIESNTTVGR